MREEQVELLKRMTSLLERINTDDPILEKISQLMYEIGSNVNSNDYTALSLLTLPTTHKTLNSRAHIIQILNELEEYLNIKSQFGSLKLHSEI